MTPVTALDDPSKANARKRSLIHGHIDRIDPLGPNVTMLKIRVAPASAFAWTPGQYIEVLGADGRFRCFSLARSRLVDGCIELHIARVPNGAFSDHTMRVLKTGDALSWRGPIGEFGWRRDVRAKHAVFLCTGTGFAPVRAIVESLQFERPASMPISIYWGGRASADHYLSDLAHDWARSHSGIRFVPMISRRTQGIGDARVGYVQHAVADDFDSLADAVVYACGSPAMVSNARDLLIGERGLRHDAFFADPFGLVDAPLAAMSHAAIQIRANGIPHSVSTDQTLLAALRGAGVAMQSVCGGRGACGTCVVELEDASRALVAAPTRDERDLLECLPNLTARSRLACQIRLERSADGLSVSL